jgi:hypothetical protein
MEHPARRIGGLAGLVIGIAFAAVSVVFGIPDAWFPPNAAFLLATIVAGGVGGWFMGPSAWAARTPPSWLASILGLALAALVIGDIVVVGSTIGAAAFGGSPVSSEGPISVAIGVVGLLVIGLLVIGPFTAPVTLAAAVLWAVLMSLIRRSIGADPRLRHRELPPRPARTGEAFDR